MLVSRKISSLATAAVLCFCLANAVPARAEIFLFLEGIPGKSTDANHKDWINVASFSHHIKVGPGPAQPQHGSILLTKQVDKSSPKLALFCNRGATIPSARLGFTRFLQERVVYFKIDLEEVLVTTLTNAGDIGGDAVAEIVGLEYERVEWSYTEFRPDGSVRDEISSWWNLPERTGGMGNIPEPDNDNDGIPDSIDPDDDNDGIPDVYELANGLNSFVNDAAADRDGDGASNYNEFIAGTAANNANSVFRVLRTQTEGEHVRVIWSSVAGKNYEVFSADELTGAWNFHASVASAGTGQTSTLIPRGAAPKYFKIRVLP